MNFTIVFWLWGVMAAIVLLTALYRKRLAKQEDNILHLHDGEGEVVKHQASVAHRLEIIDRFGKTATALAFAGGVVIAAFYMYQTWVQNGLPQ